MTIEEREWRAQFGFQRPSVLQNRRLFTKHADFCATKIRTKKRPEIWENVVRDARNSPRKATRQLSSGAGGI